jgi:hypothetical protein
MCWALNHQNIIEMAQRHISLSITPHIYLKLTAASLHAHNLHVRSVS